MGKVYIQGEIAIQNNKKSQVPHVRALGKVVATKEHLKAM